MGPVKCVIRTGVWGQWLLNPWRIGGLQKWLHEPCCIAVSGPQGREVLDSTWDCAGWGHVRLMFVPHGNIHPDSMK